MYMLRAIQALRRDQSGMILPLVLALLALGLLLITPALGHGSAAMSGTSVTESRAEELHAADSGIEEGLFWLMNGHEDNAYWTWDEEAGTGARQSYDLNGAAVSIAVQPVPSLGPNYYRIDSVAVSARGTTTVLSQVWAAPGAETDYEGGTFEGDVFIDGDGTLKAHDQINGDVVVTGDFTLNAQTGVEGSISVAGDYIQHAQTTVTGDLCAGGSITFKAHSDLDGDIYLRLDDGESALIEYQGQATTGDIYLATAGSSNVTITLNNKDQCGDIYIGVGVTLTPNFHSQSVHGNLEYGWDEVTPPPPDCPGFDSGGTAIVTYEIL